MRSPLKRPPLNYPSGEAWEEVVRQNARSLPYPSTPDVADRVLARITNRRPRATTRPQLIWVATLLLALLLTLWAVPPVRAAILEFLQIGAVRIWLVEPTPSPAPTVIATAIATATASPVEQANTLPSTPVLTPTPPSWRNLAGRTTLAEAEAQAGFQIRLPTYPPDLGPPNEVFYQLLNGPVVVLVWIEPERPDQPEISLHILGNGAFAHKTNPPVVMTTTVNGRDAAWTNGPYMLAYGAGSEAEWEMRYLVSGRVLIWEEAGLTYRLESNLSLEEATRMAESLR